MFTILVEMTNAVGGKRLAEISLGHSVHAYHWDDSDSRWEKAPGTLFVNFANSGVLFRNQQMETKHFFTYFFKPINRCDNGKECKENIRLWAQGVTKMLIHSQWSLGVWLQRWIEKENCYFFHIVSLFLVFIVLQLLVDIIYTISQTMLWYFT